MKRNNIQKMMLLAAGLLALSACDSYLDELPDNRMELKSKEEVSKLLVSAYPTISSDYLLETYSDNVDEYIGTGLTEWDKAQTEAWNWEDITSVTQETPQSLWNVFYTSIATANQAIEYIEEQDDQSEYSAQLGEALLCRAFGAYKLAEVFLLAYDPATASTDLGLPYPTKPETTIGVEYERGTLADFYANIEADLERGLPLITNDYSSPKYHFTQSAAYAFACRFYLNYRKFDKAVECATKVLGSSPSSKLRDWADWKELSSNNQIQPNDYVSSNKATNLLLLSVYSAWGVLSQPYSAGTKYRHGKLISDNETLESKGPWGDSNDVLGYTVFYNPSFIGHCIRTIPYAFEYTDVQAGIGYNHSVFVEFSNDRVLMERAEAYALMGNYQAAVDDINSEMSAYWTSNRHTLTLDEIVSFYNDIKYYTPQRPTVKKRLHTTLVTDQQVQEPLLQCILHLQRILTIQEGQRMQTVKRYGITIHRRSLDKSQALLEVRDSMAAGDPRQAIQLPPDVISAGMTPNPR